MSLEDLANHIAASDAFQAIYPNFTTNQEFAEAFLGSLMGGEDVPAALVAAAVDIVVGLLNDGLSRGALALAAVGALGDIYEQGEAHAAYGDLGGVAKSLFNKVAVSEYYTLTLRIDDPSSSALNGVTSDPDSVMAANDALDAYIAEHGSRGEVFEFTLQRDDLDGTAGNDVFVADVSATGSGSRQTLQSFDAADGGAGYDTMEIYDAADLDIDAATRISNIERVEINTVGGVEGDMSGWDGLESVVLEDVGGNVSLTVDGASVTADRKYGGAVTIIGASGEVDVETGEHAVRIGSGAHTTSVKVKGGSTVDVNASGASGAGGQSQTVTSVWVDGVKGEDLGPDGKRGTQMEAKANPLYDAEATGSGPETFKYLTAAGQTALDGITGAQTAVDVLTATEGDDAHVTNTASAAVMVPTEYVEGKRVEQGTENSMDGTDSDDVPVHVNSDALESISLSNTWATVAVINKSESEDLSVTVNKYGTAAIGGKLCLTDGSEGHESSPANVSINVEGDSNFILAGNATKMVDITLGADLTLGVTTFANPNPSTPSGTLESVMLSGSGKFTMNANGLAKLASIGAGGTSGSVNISNVGGSVMSYEGGSGSDNIGMATHAEDGIAANLGDGNDSFSSGASDSDSRVDGGAGRDTLNLTSAAGYTYGQGSATTSIYSNFEVLDIGGTDADSTYNVALLGVDSVIASESADGTVTLADTGDGVGISVNGKGAGTMATIIHQMKDRDPGDARYSGVLEVALSANGAASATSPTGQAELTLTVDSEIEVLEISSSATPGGKQKEGAYTNMLTLNVATGQTAGSVQVLDLSGSAKLEVSAADTTPAFSALEVVDALANSGGITVDASTSTITGAIEMLGGSGADNFTASNNGSEIAGNGGGDSMTGGNGADMFQYSSASHSQLSFDKDDNAQGMDMITGFSTGDDKIALSKPLFDALLGSSIKSTWTPGTGLTDLTRNWNFGSINITNTDETDTIASSLKEFIGNGKNFFETRGNAVTGGIGGDTAPRVQNDVATIAEGSDLWVFIDVNENGDLDLSEDIAIKMIGISSIATGDFALMT